MIWEDEKYSLKIGLRPITAVQILLGVKRMSLINLRSYEIYYKLYSLVFVTSCFLFKAFSEYFEVKLFEIAISSKKWMTYMFLLFTTIKIIDVTFVKENLFTKLYKDLLQVDLILRHKQEPQIYVNMKKVSTFMCVLLISYFISFGMYVCHVGGSKYFTVDLFYEIFSQFLLYSDMFIYLHIVRTVNLRYSMVTNELCRLSITESSENNLNTQELAVKTFNLDISKTTTRKDPDMKPTDLYSVYFKLLNMCQIINSIFNVQLFAQITSTFMANLLMIDVMVSHSSVQGILVSVLPITLIAASFNFICLCSLCFNCGNVQYETQKIRSIARRLLTLQKYDEKNTTVLQQLIQLDTPQFTVLGVTLDRKFILSYLSLATTYAIILMQFHNITIN